MVSQVNVTAIPLTSPNPEPKFPTPDDDRHSATQEDLKTPSTAHLGGPGPRRHRDLGVRVRVVAPEKKSGVFSVMRFCQATQEQGVAGIEGGGGAGGPEGGSRRKSELGFRPGMPL